MKILFFQGAHPDDKIGGSELQSWILAKQLSKLGHSVFYLATKSNVTKFEQFEKLGVTVVKLSSKRKYSISDIRQILKAIHSCAPDIIYLRFFDYVVLNLFISYLFNCRVFYHVSSDWDGLYVLDTLKSYMKIILRLVNRFSINFYDGVIFQTEQQKNMFNLVRHRSIVIPNSYEKVHSFVKKTTYLKVVLWVNNIKKNKNPSAFIRLAEMCPDYQFLMIGYPDNLLLSSNIQENEEDLTNFKYIPGVPYDLILEYFENASVFINTSFQEGFPNTIIQAMITQTPILSLYIDPDECFSKHQTGILSSSVEQMKRDLEILLQDHAMYKKIQGSQVEYADRHFNLEKNSKRLCSFITD